MITLPGLIDPHVHLRDPGQTYKEDFYTGTQAALAGGYTTILDMPNNLLPIINEELLLKKIKEAKTKIVCDVGFYFGSQGQNTNQFLKIQKHVFGLKIYLNQTTGNFLVSTKVFQKIAESWPDDKPILLHAEDETLYEVLNITKNLNKKIHVCHVSSEQELKFIIDARSKGLKITCGVTPHHLFLNQEDLTSLDYFCNVKPSLKTRKDNRFLWKNLKYIDIIESDHAPHTIEDKKNGAFGFPGLETTLPLLLTEAHKDKITLKDITRLCHENPAKIFNIKTTEKTYIEIDEEAECIINNKTLFTKCAWSPFEKRKIKGKVKKVFLRGTKVYEDGKILIKPGFGQIIKP